MCCTSLPHPILMTLDAISLHLVAACYVFLLLHRSLTQPHIHFCKEYGEVVHLQSSEWVTVGLLIIGCGLAYYVSAVYEIIGLSHVTLWAALCMLTWFFFLVWRHWLGCVPSRSGQGACWICTNHLFWTFVVPLHISAAWWEIGRFWLPSS